MIEFILNNWGELLLAGMAFLKVVVNLIPSPAGDKPRQVFAYLDLLVDAIISNNSKKEKQQ
jgi:hypothetical protein